LKRFPSAVSTAILYEIFLVVPAPAVEWQKKEAKNKETKKRKKRNASTLQREMDWPKLITNNCFAHSFDK